jgi:fibronectin-binding autotransporter adhesin
MKAKNSSKINFSLHFPLSKAVALSLGFLVEGAFSNSAHATNLYWDTNGTAAGSGGVAGTWGTSMYWSTDSTGLTAPTVTTTAVTNDLFFSAGGIGTFGNVNILAAGVTANSITFSQPGAVTLNSGGAITLATSGTITTNNATDTINVVLAGSNITKNGTGNLTMYNLANAGLNGFTIASGTVTYSQNQATTLGVGAVTLGSDGNNATLTFDKIPNLSNVFTIAAGAGTRTITNTYTAGGGYIDGCDRSKQRSHCIRHRWRWRDIDT